MRQPKSTDSPSPQTTDVTFQALDGEITVIPTRGGQVQIIAGSDGSDWGVDIEFDPWDAERLAAAIIAAARAAVEHVAAPAQDGEAGR